MSSSNPPTTNPGGDLDISLTPSSLAKDDGWTVTPVWSDGDTENSKKFARQLEDILNRTRTYSILSDILFRPIVAVLILAWTFALWKKHARTGGPKLGWRDGVALGAVITCAYHKLMAGAIGLTAAYAAWSTWADMAWIGDGNLPSFNSFITGLRRVDMSKTARDATAEHQGEPNDQNSEPSALDGTEADPNLPEGEQDSDDTPDCVVCWSSDEPPLQLPCTHHVCLDCLHRLKEASRYQCPFCRVPLYSLHNTKVYLFQLAVAATGAQIALAIVRSALKIAQRQYWGAAGNLFFNLMSGLAALHGYSRVHVLGEEGYLAGVSESKMYMQLATTLHWVWWGYDGIGNADWATFIDDRWQRSQADEWRSAREFVCWIAPKAAAYVAKC